MPRNINFKKIKGFEDYKISNDGKILGKQGKPLKQFVSSKNCCRVHLFRENKGWGKLVHRLVLENFLCVCPSGKQCNHKNGDRTDNTIENLEWVTPQENIRHAIDTGLWDPKGESANGSKLKEGEVWLIKKILQTNILSQENMAKMFKITQSAISRIKAKKRWKHILFQGG